MAMNPTMMSGATGATMVVLNGANTQLRDRIG